MSKRIMTIIQITLTIIILLTGIKIYKYSINLKETDNIKKETEELLNADDDLMDPNVEKEKNIKASQDFISKLSKDYPDTIGYIKIDNTVISYPIVQTKDNAYYLTHSPKKEHNLNGSIFLNHANKSNFSDENTILYGHNVKSGKLFQNLHKFKKQEFYDETNTIEIYTSEGLKTYKIFSVYTTNPNYQYKYANFNSIEDKNEFIKEVIDKSLVDVNLSESVKYIGKSISKDTGTGIEHLNPEGAISEDIINGNIEDLKGITEENQDNSDSQATFENIIFEANSKMLTLSTCETGGKQRLVVHGIEL